MTTPARQIAEAAPLGAYLELEGQDHGVAADVVAPALKRFFLGGGSA
jgi:hypothetical protein